MKSFDKQVKCPDCEIPYEKNEEGIFVCPACGREETLLEREARHLEDTRREIEEEGKSYKERSEFEKHAKEYDEHSFEKPQRLKIKSEEFDETATSAESGALLVQIKKRQEEARAAEDEKRLIELVHDEEKIQHEHDRHLAHEARERAKAQKLEEQMPFELIIDNDGLVKMRFGRYPQSVVTDERMISILDEKLKESSFVKNERGWFKFGNIMYSAIPAFPYDQNSNFENGETIEAGKYYYFRVEPIFWRVLDVRDDEAVLLSDKVLTVKDYNADNRNGKWSDSYIRDWLNMSFFARAFTLDEQKWLKHDRLDNTTTAHKSTKAYVGENTEDSVFLLSHSEAVKRIMGFSIVSDKKDPERRAYPTDYAKAMGAVCSHAEDCEGYTNWWLRSPGTTERSASSVEPTGKISLLYGATLKMGVRAAIRIKPNPKKTV
ncbi:MAG TPA: DUF6273 domain-containing protein [Clostridia bacterium]|nr:DUF6273 domain-containing protein [Clostridia bacterium]